MSELQQDTTSVIERAFTLRSFENPPRDITSSVSLTSGLDQEDEQSPFVNPPRCTNDGKREEESSKRRRVRGKQPTEHSKVISCTPATAGDGTEANEYNVVTAAVAAASLERSIPLPSGVPSVPGKGRPTAEGQVQARSSVTRPGPERGHPTRA